MGLKWNLLRFAISLLFLAHCTNAFDFSSLYNAVADQLQYLNPFVNSERSSNQGTADLSRYADENYLNESLIPHRRIKVRR